jgi:hypothetical protein
MADVSDTKEEILSRLKDLWYGHPQQRFGQLLENYVFYHGQRGDKTSVALFYQQDSETVQILRERKVEKTRT